MACTDAPCRLCETVFLPEALFCRGFRLVGVTGEVSFLLGATSVAYLLILLTFLDWREVRAALIEMLSLGVTES